MQVASPIHQIWALTLERLFSIVAVPTHTPYGKTPEKMNVAGCREASPATFIFSGFPFPSVVTERKG